MYKDSIPPLFNQSHVLKSSAEKGESFNSKFFLNSTYYLSIYNFQLGTENLSSDMDITSSMFSAIIINLDLHKACGSDGIP